jgi:hypothetical protein
MGRGLRWLTGGTVVLVLLAAAHAMLWRAVRVDYGPTVRLVRMATIAWGVSRFEPRMRRYRSGYSRLYPELLAPDRLRFVCTLHPDNRSVRRRGVAP